MKRIITALAIAAMLVLSPLRTVAANESASLPGVLHYTITDASAHTIAIPQDGALVYLLGFQNLGAAAQTATVSCWNNTAASGDLLAGPIALPVPTTPIAYPLDGLLATNGLTCQASAAPTGGGIQVLYAVL